MVIAAGEFKSHCLKLMDEVKKKHTSFVITKRGKPVAKLVPIDDTPPLLFGRLKGRISIEHDIIAPTGERWNADARPLVTADQAITQYAKSGHIRVIRS